MAATNDEKPRDLIYDVIGMPTYGMIVKKIVGNPSNQTLGICVKQRCLKERKSFIHVAKIAVRPKYYKKKDNYQTCHHRVSMFDDVLFPSYYTLRLVLVS